MGSSGIVQPPPLLDEHHGLTYTLGPNGTFEIAGERAGQVVVYISTEPLTEFVASARAAIVRGGGS